MSDSNDMSQQLANLKDGWKNTKPQSEDIFPEGIFQFRIDEATLTSVEDKKNGGKIPAVVFSFVCLSEPYKGKVIKTWDRLNPNMPNTISFFKEKLKRLGLDSEVDLEALELEINKAIRCIVTARVQNKRSGDRVFSNVYINSNDGVDNSV